MAITKNVGGLERRLAANELLPADKEQLELTRRVLALRREGATQAEIGAAVGQSVNMIQKFMGRSAYRLFVAHLQRVEQNDDDKLTQDTVRKAKAQFAGFANDAIDYYRTCFARNAEEDHEDKGVFRDDAKAMWATEKVSKGLGFTEPETAVRPIVNINIAHIVAEQKMVDQDDARASQAVIDVTPTVES